MILTVLCKADIDARLFYLLPTTLCQSKKCLVSNNMFACVQTAGTLKKSFCELTKAKSCKKNDITKEHCTRSNLFSNKNMTTENNTNHFLNFTIEVTNICS